MQVAQRKRILVVDDEPLIRQSLRMLLRLDGHLVEEAHSGREALERVDQQEFDLVFTDYALPGMTGDELARSIRESNPRLPVVMVTGHPLTPPPKEVTRIIMKPFGMTTIREIIDELAA